jgi:hypothetical protein
MSTSTLFQSPVSAFSHFEHKVERPSRPRESIVAANAPAPWRCARAHKMARLLWPFRAKGGVIVGTAIFAVSEIYVKAA